MVKLSLCVNWKSPSILPLHSHSNMHECKIQPAARVKTVSTFAAKSSGFSSKPAAQGCQKCGGKGAIECPGCKGTGRNKKNGNIFERWKCFDCQGFGLKSCPNCGKGGLTPEQRGER